jgi:hypothetical protein
MGPQQAGALSSRHHQPGGMFCGRSDAFGIFLSLFASKGNVLLKAALAGKLVDGYQGSWYGPGVRIPWSNS